MCWIHNLLPHNCPKLVFEDQSKYLLIMEAVRPPFQNLKDLLISGEIKSEYFQQAGAILGKIHVHGGRKEQVPSRLYDNQFFQSLRIAPYYLHSANHVPEVKNFIEGLIQECKMDPYTFTHGDFSPKNLLVKDRRLILVDHEVAHFGDGTFDLGFFVTHLLSKSIYLPQLSSQFLRGVETFYEAYQGFVDLKGEHQQRAVKHTLACLLARVCGLSPLEYLSQPQRNQQKSIAIRMMESTPTNIKELISTFDSLLHA